MLLDDRAGGIGPFLPELRQIDLLHRSDPDRAQVDELNRLIELEPIDALVREAETAGEVIEPATPQPVGIDLEREFVALAEIADVGLVTQALSRLLNAFFAQPDPGLAAEPRQDARRPGRDRRRRCAHEGLGEFVLHVGIEEPQGGQHARGRRHDHRIAAGEHGHRVAVQRTGAAEGDQRKIPRIEALLHGDKPQRAEHVLVDDVEDALRRVDAGRG